jgi:hypothetical protein
MKATIILSALILFSGLMGCSDNLNVTEPLNYAKSQPNNNNTPRVEILWEQKELAASTSFSTSDQFENRAYYYNPPFTMIASYEVSFDVTTNAGKFTNGFLPLVKVSKDQEVVFESSSYPSAEGEATTHVTVNLDNVRFSELEVYIALIPVDNAPNNHTDDTSTILKLTKITLCRMN